MAKKLLLADDSVTIQKVVNLTFADEDIVVETVGNGDQALEKAKTLQPNIVLADVIMPGRSGYEVCAGIKTDPDLARIPVVLLVGTFEPFDEVEASRVKCDGYLTKPFDTSELIQLVHSLIEKASGNGTPEQQADEEVPAAAAEAAAPRRSQAARLVSDRSWDSFMGSSSILDLFGSAPARSVESRPSPASAPAKPAAVLPSKKPDAPLVTPDSGAETKRARQGSPLQVIPFPGGRSASEVAPLAISEDVMNAIVDRVVERMSTDVVREVAWEVIPELSEIIIRQFLEERDKSDES